MSVWVAAAGQGGEGWGRPTHGHTEVTAPPLPPFQAWESDRKRTCRGRLCQKWGNMKSFIRVLFDWLVCAVLISMHTKYGMVLLPPVNKIAFIWWVHLLLSSGPQKHTCLWDHLYIQEHQTRNSSSGRALGFLPLPPCLFLLTPTTTTTTIIGWPCSSPCPFLLLLLLHLSAMAVSRSIISAPPPLFLLHPPSLFPFLPEEQMGFNSGGMMVGYEQSLT